MQKFETVDDLTTELWWSTLTTYQQLRILEEIFSVETVAALREVQGKSYFELSPLTKATISRAHARYEQRIHGED